jgi:hypothetical protein
LVQQLNGKERQLQDEHKKVVDLEGAKRTALS